MLGTMLDSEDKLGKTSYVPALKETKTETLKFCFCNVQFWDCVHSCEGCNTHEMQTLSFKALLWAECTCPQIHMLRFNPQCDGIRR